MTDHKPFSLGILVGRFQVLHAGHAQMIQTAIDLCGTVGVFVGSSQESGTCKNPFPYALREEMLLKLFGDQIRVIQCFFFPERKKGLNIHGVPLFRVLFSIR